MASVKGSLDIFSVRFNYHRESILNQLNQLEYLGKSSRDSVMRSVVEIANCFEELRRLRNETAIYEVCVDSDERDCPLFTKSALDSNVLASEPLLDGLQSFDRKLLATIDLNDVMRGIKQVDKRLALLESNTHLVKAVGPTVYPPAVTCFNIPQRFGELPNLPKHILPTLSRQHSLF